MSSPPMAEGLCSQLRIVDDESSDERPSDEQICNICLLNFAKYTCPRCNIRYCSLNCYKGEKHEQCSESFYRDSFMTELKQQKRSPEEKQKMLEMLKRLEEEQSGSDSSEATSDPAPSLGERLGNLNLDTEIDSVWERLTPSEQKEFEDVVKSGKIGHLITVYKPWWEVFSPVSPLVKDKDVDTSSDAESQPTTPTPLADLPALKTLVKSGAVSPCLKYSIVNVLYAYVYIVRLFNGDHLDLCVQASQALLDISSCLSTNVSFSSVGEALHHAMATVKQNKELFNSNEFCLSIFKDVSCILCHPQSHDCHVIQALSDVHKLFGLAKAQMKSTSEGQSDEDSAAAAKRVWLARKKVYFFAVFANEFSDDLSPLSKVVDIEYGNETKLLQDERERREKVVVRRVKDRGETKPLIEELT